MSVVRAVEHRTPFALTGLRWAGAAMLAIGLAWPTGHPNFGLPCPLRTVTGIPCPFCGMTTSVVALLHGHPAEAFVANPFGIVAVGVALVLLLWRRTSEWRLPTIAVFVAVIVSWVFQLNRFNIF